MPVGWIKGPDGQYELDPEVKDTIRLVFDTFWQVRSIRRAVKALNQAGVTIPSRRGKRMYSTRPSLANVKRLLTNPAYSGTYCFGKTKSLPGARVLANGQSARINVPEEQWIKTFNHHPTYVSLEEQEQIKAILKSNRFETRTRAGRGPAILQGLTRCASCEDHLVVSYSRNKHYSYGCGWKTLQYAEKPCTRFISYEFDGMILRELFKVLETPPLGMLKAAWQESRKQEQARILWIQSERERLEHETRRAEELVDRTHGEHARVYNFAYRKLEVLLKEREEFEQRITNERSTDKANETEKELEELCGLASDIPRLWHHTTVTHHERKEILRCIIDKIVVAATKEKIDATIFWKSGHQTPISIWRGVGRYSLIRELHAEGLTVVEIQERLQKGQNSTGQSIKLTIQRLYVILGKLGLKPNRFPIAYESLRREAATLNKQGRSLKWIARNFNERGMISPSGEVWNYQRVRLLVRAIRKSPYTLRELHLRAVQDARKRGLDYRQMADEFNLQNIRRRDGQPWTPKSVRLRWAQLNQRFRIGGTTRDHAR